MTLFSNNWRDRLLLISPFFFWGTAMVAMKGVIPQTSPLFLAALRILPAGFLVLLAASLMGQKQPKSWRAWLWIVLFGLVDGTLFQGFLAFGLERTSAGLGSVMIDSQPLAVAILALILYGERVGAFGWLGLLLGVIGISLIGFSSAGVSLDTVIGLDFSDLGPWVIQGLNQGEILMLMAALSMAVGTVMIRKVSQTADAVVATGWHMVIGGVPLLLGSLSFEADQIEALSASHWGAIAYSSIFGSAIAYGLFFFFASKGNLTSLSSLTFLTPVFALLFGNLFLGEVLNSIQLFGVMMTLISIFLVNQRELVTQVFTNSDLSFGEKVMELLGLSSSKTTSEPIRVPVETRSLVKKS